MQPSHVMRASLRQPASAATYSASELKLLIGVNLNAIYKLAQSGEIPNIRVGRRFVFPRVAIDRWLATAGGKAPM